MVLFLAPTFHLYLNISYHPPPLSVNAGAASVIPRFSLNRRHSFFRFRYLPLRNDTHLPIHPIHRRSAAPPRSCDAATEFRCDDGVCVDLRRRCDSIPDCPQAEDEANCGRQHSRIHRAFIFHHFTLFWSRCPQNAAFRLDGSLEMKTGGCPLIQMRPWNSVRRVFVFRHSDRVL